MVIGKIIVIIAIVGIIWNWYMYFFVLVFWSAYKNDRKKNYFRTAAPAEISDCCSNQSNERYFVGTNVMFFFSSAKLGLCSGNKLRKTQTNCRGSLNWTTSNALKWRLTVYEWKEKPNSRLFLWQSVLLVCAYASHDLYAQCVDVLVLPRRYWLRRNSTAWNIFFGFVNILDEFLILRAGRIFRNQWY